MEQLQRELASLSTAIANDDITALHAILLRTVEGFTPDLRFQEAAALNEQAAKAPSSTIH